MLFKIRAALLVVPVLATGCAGGPTRVDEQVEQRAADDPQAITRIADAAAASGDLQAARAFAGRAAQLAQDDPQAQIRYARSLSVLGQGDEAVSVLRRAQARQPDNATLLLTLGRLLVAQNQPDAAIGVFRHGIAVAPQNAALRIGLGVALDLRRDAVGAQASYLAALAINPADVGARNDLALSLALSGHVADAIARLQALHVELDAGGAPAGQRATVQDNLALAYGLAGNVPAAMQTGTSGLTPAERSANARFYSLLAAGPPSGIDDSSGLPVTAGVAAARPTAGAAN